MNKKVTALLICSSLGLASFATAQAKDCEEVKQEIAAKLDQKGVSGYTLEVMDKDAPAEDKKVVGTCGGGKSKIVYTRG